MNNSMGRNRGFSLIELMVVVAIVAILASIAYPSYLDYVVRTRRTAAAACLTELGQFMERYHTTNLSYVGAALPATGCQDELADFYAFDFSGGEPTASAYAITATAGGVQADKDTLCGNLTLIQTGAKSISGTASSANECW